MSTEKFELFAIVELFGHQRMAGKVSEQQIGGGNFVRVDVPDTKEQPAFTRFINPSAIYAINPVSEEVASGMAERLQAKPIQIWDAEEILKRIQEKAPQALKEAEVDDDQDDDYRMNE